jgi:hypothetical protein
MIARNARIVKVEGVPLTHELASAFAAMTPVEGERPLKEARLHFLGMHLEKGTFFGVEWHKGVERGSGKLYRLNGQHSSHLLIGLEPDKFPAGLLATITTWEFDAPDKPDIFDYFDNPRSARSNTDKMATYKAEHPDLEHIDLDLLVHAANGLHVYNAGIENGFTLPPRNRGVYFDQAEYRQFARWIDSFKDSLNKWLLGQAGITAEMFADYNKSEPLASEFWGYVLRENHPDVDHESRELARVFNDWKSSARNKTQADFRKKASTYWKRYNRMTPPSAPSPTPAESGMLPTANPSAT